MCAFGGVLAYELVHSSKWLLTTGPLGGAGALLLVLLLVRARAELVPWPPALLGVAYAVELVIRGSTAGRAASPSVPHHSPAR